MGDLNIQANFHLQFLASWWQKKNIRWQKHKKLKWFIKPHNGKHTRYYYYYLLTITGTHCFLFVRYAIVRYAIMQLIIRCEKLNCDNVLIITFFQFSFSMKIKTFCSFCKAIFSKYFWATEAGWSRLSAFTCSGSKNCLGLHMYELHMHKFKTKCQVAGSKTASYLTFCFNFETWKLPTGY